MGRAQLEFARVSGRTHLTRRLYTWPFVVGRPFYEEDAPGSATIVLQSAAGTLNDGDHHATGVVLHEGAAARIRGQGAMSVNRATDGPGVREETMIEVGDGARLQYLPELRVLFPGARLDQRTVVRLAGHGTALVADGMVTLRGESGSGFAEYSAELVIERDGSLLVHERSRAHDWSRLPGRVATFTAFGQVLLLTAADRPGDGPADRPGDGPAEPPLAVDQALRTVSRASTKTADQYVSCSALPHDAGIVVRAAAVDGMHLRRCLDEVTRLLQPARPARVEPALQARMER